MHSVPPYSPAPPCYIPHVLPLPTPLIPVLLEVLSSRLPTETILHIASYIRHPLLRFSGSKNNSISKSYCWKVPDKYTEAAKFWGYRVKDQGKKIAGICIGLKIDINLSKRFIGKKKSGGERNDENGNLKEEGARFTVNLSPPLGYYKDESRQRPVHFEECRLETGTATVAMLIGKGKNERWDFFMDNVRTWPHFIVEIVVKKEEDTKICLLGYEVGLYAF